MRNLPRNIWHLPRNAILQFLRLYQVTLSPDHGPLRHLHDYGYCRHSPTCSEYAIEHITSRGLVIGSFFAIRRILTCHPWHEPHDEKVLQTLEEHFPKKP